MIRIIVINGYAGVGKDEFVKACQKQYGNVYNLSMIDSIKNIAKKIGWDGKKDDNGRRFLSDLKDALTRYDDIPFKAIKKQIDMIAKENSSQKTYIFIHAREPEDIQRLVEEFNAFTLLIRRAQVEQKNYGNHADANVLNYQKYDYIYLNNGDLKTLSKDVKDFIKVVDKFGSKYEVQE